MYHFVHLLWMYAILFALLIIVVNFSIMDLSWMYALYSLHDLRWMYALVLPIIIYNKWMPSCFLGLCGIYALVFPRSPWSLTDQFPSMMDLLYTLVFPSSIMDVLYAFVFLWSILDVCHHASLINYGYILGGIWKGDSHIKRTGVLFITFRGGFRTS